jgi:hypothetical protein
MPCSSNAKTCSKQQQRHDMHQAAATMHAGVCNVYRIMV